MCNEISISDFKSAVIPEMDTCMHGKLMYNVVGMHLIRLEKTV